MDPPYVLKAAFWNSARFTSLVQRDYGLGEDIGLDAVHVDAAVYGFLVVLPLALAGAFTRRARSAPLWFWACPALMWAVTVVLAGFIRYRSPIDPFVVLLAALAVVGALERLPNRTA
jgi:hypothetical protein